MMSEIRDRAKDKIKDKILKYHNVVLFEDEVDDLLSIPELAVVDRRTELPPILIDPKYTRVEIIRQYKEILQNKGWVKEIKND